mmetsp:Transcript_29717/g.94701  ORF Transcript_29717/g.94701 Transcript_29717/m.94701 type:complete len:290 (-) Transcript_29717:1741-2610(-)
MIWQTAVGLAVLLHARRTLPGPRMMEQPLEDLHAAKPGARFWGPSLARPTARCSAGAMTRHAMAAVRRAVAVLPLAREAVKLMARTAVGMARRAPQILRSTTPAAGLPQGEPLPGQQAALEETPAARGVPRRRLGSLATAAAPAARTWQVLEARALWRLAPQVRTPQRPPLQMRTAMMRGGAGSEPLVPGRAASLQCGAASARCRTPATMAPSMAAALVTVPRGLRTGADIHLATALAVASRSMLTATTTRGALGLLSPRPKARAKGLPLKAGTARMTPGAHGPQTRML